MEGRLYMYNQIVFMTGNRTKLAHLRHIGKDLSLPINLFHEQTYYATYDEPRIYNREQLLKESVDSALSQIKKAKINSPNRLFLIEDTSVIIESLSTKEEFPGLDVKYWMKSTSFSKLNSELSRTGNRSAYVRSDMVLFNADKSIYQHFTGFSYGSIVEQEQQINTHLLYPWLDNKTFNKWFIPDGESVPISLLPIEKADTADFRRKAFEQVIQYISEQELIAEPDEHQFPLFPSRSLLIIVGFSCSGKTTIAQHLSAQNNIKHIEASDFMRVAFQEIHGSSSPYNIEKFASTALYHKPEIVAEKIVKYLTEFNHQTDVLLTGFRSPKEAEFLKEQLSEIYSINLIEVTADFETRYQRALARKRQGDATSDRQAFEQKDASQEQMGIEKFEALTLENMGSFDDLFNLFNRINKQLLLVEAPQEDVTIKLGVLKAAVMAFLSKHYDVNGQGRFFTTTEISKQIEHHKNNISRFFNQNFSPEFETKVENDIVKYRLSNTGYSKLCLYEHYSKAKGFKVDSDESNLAFDF